MWKMVDLSIVASSGQGRVFGGRPRDEEMRVQLQSYVRLLPEGEKHTVLTLPAVTNQRLSQEQVCVSGFRGHSR